MPAVGPDTVRVCLDAGIAVLALEAHKTLLLDKDELLALADAAGLCVLGVDPGAPIVIRAGVVGVGYLGKFHAQKYASLDGVQLVGVVDVDAERAEAVAAQYGTTAFTDYQALVGRVDCVSLAVPTPLHYPVARPCSTRASTSWSKSR